MFNIKKKKKVIKYNNTFNIFVFVKKRFKHTQMVIDSQKFCITFTTMCFLQIKMQ